MLTEDLNGFIVIFCLVKVRFPFYIHFLSVCFTFELLKKTYAHVEPYIMNKNQSIEDLIQILEQRIEKGDYKDSVHKITLMTTLETVQHMLNGK